MIQEPLAVYIHFPYCRSRCPYCDFFRALKPKDYDEKALVERYLADIDYFAGYCGGRLVPSVFFGGGTPSLLSPAAVNQILDKLASCFVIDSNVEISLEANPNTYEQEKFTDFRSAGINRLSLGVQSLNATDLKFLGRTHSVDDALRAMEAALYFPKSSIDLIYARPNQQFDSWQQEIKQALSFGFKHLSLYELAIEEGTVFYKKNITALEEDAAATLYNQTISMLREAGFSRYEVSNFATNEDNQSQHNLVYWRGGDYIGIGEGAHGRFHADGKIYASEDGRICDILSARERALELLYMGLRIEEGIDEQRFYHACGINLADFLNTGAINKLAKLNLLCYSGGNLKLTDEGFLVLDKIALELAGDV